MLAELIIAGGGVTTVALRPRSWAGAGLVGLLAAADVAVAGDHELAPALLAVWPMLTLLVLTVSASALAVRLGVAARAATWLAKTSRGSTFSLYVRLCALCAALTACLTLDGAVVLLAPVIVDLHRRFGAPRRPLLLGVVAVANACSGAVPTGNPTNLVVLARLDLGLGEATGRLLPAGLAAAAMCAIAVGFAERAALQGRLRERLECSAAPAALAPGFAALARIAVQITALLVLVLTALRPGAIAVASLAGAVALGLAVALAAAVANNLPASVVAAVALAPGPGAYAALLGLSVGALATPHGSVATLIAGDLADENPHARVLLPVALVATAAAVALVWLGL